MVIYAKEGHAFANHANAKMSSTEDWTCFRNIMLARNDVTVFVWRSEKVFRAPNKDSPQRSLIGFPGTEFSQ